MTEGLTPLKELTAEQFTDALAANKVKDLADLYNVTVSTIHYWKCKHNGIVRPPSIAQLEARLLAKQTRGERMSTRKSTSAAEKEAQKAVKAQERAVNAELTAARRAELLAQIEALSATV